MNPFDNLILCPSCNRAWKIVNQDKLKPKICNSCNLKGHTWNYHEKIAYISKIFPRFIIYWFNPDYFSVPCRIAPRNFEGDTGSFGGIDLNSPLPYNITEDQLSLYLTFS